MKFLIDADSLHSLIQIFKKHGHIAVHVRNVLGSATDEEIFEYAVLIPIRQSSSRIEKAQL